MIAGSWGRTILLNAGRPILVDLDKGSRDIDLKGALIQVALRGDDVVALIDDSSRLRYVEIARSGKRVETVLEADVEAYRKYPRDELACGRDNCVLQSPDDSLTFARVTATGLATPFSFDLPAGEKPEFIRIAVDATATRMSLGFSGGAIYIGEIGYKALRKIPSIGCTQAPLVRFVPGTSSIVIACFRERGMMAIIEHDLDGRIPQRVVRETANYIGAVEPIGRDELLVQTTQWATTLKTIRY
jgi:hypothetical protein